jgi:hypothetical protein
LKGEDRDAIITSPYHAPESGHRPNVEYVTKV